MSPRDTPTIIEFATDPQLLGLSVSPAQATCLKTLYGLPLAPEEQEIWSRCTGRATYPGQAFGEATIIAGARAGKDSRIAAPIVLYEAVFGGHERYLAKGERGMIPLVAQDQRATRIAFHYVKDYVTASPLLASMLIEEPLSLELRLTNRTNIVCFPSTQRSLRGWSIPVAVLDELAYFRLEGQVDSDVEIQASLRRGMLSFPSPRLIKISTPYMKSGVVYEDFQKYFSHDSPDVLVWRASSLVMNPSLKAERLERERRLDPLRYAREYEAEFAEDLEAFLPSAWIEGAIVSGCYQIPPQDRVSYLAACDPSGGGRDAFTLAIVHLEQAGDERRIVQDMMKGWGGGAKGGVDLAGIVKEIAGLLKPYRLQEICGDKYAGGWVPEAFAREGLRYREAPMDKSAAYLHAEPLFAQGRLAVLDHPQLVRELRILERRPRPGGKTLVDHPHGSHDDYANALCLAAAVAGTQPRQVSLAEAQNWAGFMQGLSSVRPRHQQSVFDRAPLWRRPR